MESEFPLFPFLVSRLYQLFGVQEWLGRGLSLLCSALTIWLVIRLGRRWFGARAGWWGGLFFAIAPLGVYYGRTFQAEALLLLCGAGCLEAHSHWRRQGPVWALLLSWLCFTCAGLIKVIPLLWLGLPLLMVQLNVEPQLEAATQTNILRRTKGLLRSLGFWLYVGASLAAIATWYAHAYQLGLTSGFSFGFWGGGSDRSSLSLLLDPGNWFNLSLRVALRLLAIAGVPFLFSGIWLSWRSPGRTHGDQRTAGGSALHPGHDALQQCSRVLPVATAAVRLPLDGTGLAPVAAAMPTLAIIRLDQPLARHQPGGSVL